MAEFGWVLAREHQGNGYATEAVRASLDWAGEHLKPALPIACIIAPEKAASVRVAEKCGFTLLRRTLYQDERH